jgi:hypothetical protein
MGVERLAADVAESEDLVAFRERHDGSGGNLADGLGWFAGAQGCSFDGRRELGRELAGEGQGREEAVNLAARTDTLDDLLAEVAAFVEVQRVGLVGLLGKVFLDDVAAVGRASFEETLGFKRFG